MDVSLSKFRETVKSDVNPDVHTREAWYAAVHGVTNSRTRLSN